VLQNHEKYFLNDRISLSIRKVRISYCMVNDDEVCNIHNNILKLDNTC